MSKRAEEENLKHLFVAWLNEQTQPLGNGYRASNGLIASQIGGDDQFTAIHFAAFNGNLKLIKTLLSLGADYKRHNNLGLNSLHFAA